MWQSMFSYASFYLRIYLYHVSQYVKYNNHTTLLDPYILPVVLSDKPKKHNNHNANIFSDPYIQFMAPYLSNAKELKTKVVVG